jgi:hypothetical protein
MVGLSSWAAPPYQGPKLATWDSFPRGNPTSTLKHEKGLNHERARSGPATECERVRASTNCNEHRSARLIIGQATAQARVNLN